MPRARTEATLSLRDLNRATLARQLLLERGRVAPLEAVERVGGLQAQLPRPPFIGLWTRVKGFERAQLVDLLEHRKLARATMMRATLHLVSARDYVALRPTLQPMLTTGMNSILRTRLASLDIDALTEAARELLDERPRPFDELRVELARRLPSSDERAMGYAVRMLLPLVQLPSRDAPWGWESKAPFGLAETWLGRRVREESDERELVRRYLAAFGPATPADAATWSGLKLRDAFEQLRPELRTFRDERGRELFDLPDAPRPPGDTEAPVRFLPDFDNLVLAHDDRSRVVPPAHRARVTSKNLQVAATFLVDGFVAGSWTVAIKRGTATLAMQAFQRVTRREQSALRDEAMELVRFIEPDAKVFDATFAGAV